MSPVGPVGAGRKRSLLGDAFRAGAIPALLNEAVDLLLPAACLGCGSLLPVGSGSDLVCIGCRTRLRRPPAPRCGRCDLPRGSGAPADARCLECDEWPEVLRTARAAVVLAPPAGELVHALKYEGWRELAPLLARRMAPLAVRDAEVVVPVPTTRPRLRERGYNQAGLLAKEVALLRDVPLIDALLRDTSGGTQVSLRPDQRRSNVRGSFRPRSRDVPGVRGRRALLVDDVLTTGATASDAGRALAEAGAREVHLLSFARALPYRMR